MAQKIDLLDRNPFIHEVLKMIKQLSTIQKGCCFSIEGSWGIGKTFILETIAEELEKEPNEPYFVFYYNCWQHDYYDEPSIAIISAMISSIKEDSAVLNTGLEDAVKAGYQFVGNKFKEIAGLYLENKIGINLISWADEIKQNKDKNAELEFDKMFNFSQTIETVRKKLQEIADKRTIVLIVDELDRCIPAYAIKVLERLHHIFYGLNNTVVIMAVDRNQLEHSVEEMFGISCNERSMNVDKYLKKFIDFSMILDYGKTNNSFRLKYKDYFDNFIIRQESDEQNLYDILSTLLYGIDIRRQEKLFEKAYMVHSLTGADQTDLSVLAFELMYEILRLWGFTSMDKVAEINDAQYTNLEQTFGTARINNLKRIVASAEVRRDNVKYLSINLYGKMIGYFSVIFNQSVKEHLFLTPITGDYEKELQIVKNFCEYCEMIK